MSNDPLYYERLGESDFEKFMSDYDVSRRIKLIFNYILSNVFIPSDASVLEIGCGTGKISSEIAKKNWKLTVNDISEKLCKRVANSLDCHYLPGDCSDLSCKSETFDLIISSECIEHTLEPWKVMKEMNRVLKPGGHLILTTPNRLWYPILLLSCFLRLRKFHGIENWTWPQAMQRWLRQNNFTDICFNGCHLWPWQFPLAKCILPIFDKWGHSIYPIMINYGFSARKIH